MNRPMTPEQIATLEATSTLVRDLHVAIVGQAHYGVKGIVANIAELRGDTTKLREEVALLKVKVQSKPVKYSKLIGLVLASGTCAEMVRATVMYFKK